MEVSGKSSLDFQGRVLTGGGTLLLDPATLEIVTGGGVDKLDPGALADLLDTQNVDLQATSSITVTSLMDASGNTNADLINSNNLRFSTPELFLNAPVILKSGAEITGTATLIHVGAGGLVRNAVDAAIATGSLVPVVNLASGATAATTYHEFNIDITKAITINGHAMYATDINASSGPAGSRRVFEINPGAGNVVTLNRLGITGGNTITKSRIFGNTASGAGGSIYIDITSGPFQLIESTVASNIVSATVNSGPPLVRNGGGMYVQLGQHPLQ